MDFNCDHCRKLYTVPDQAVGLPIKCPSCGRGIVAGGVEEGTRPEEQRSVNRLSLAAKQRTAGDGSDGPNPIVAFSIPTDLHDTTSGYKNVFTWLWGPGIAVITTLLVHWIMVAISLYAKELPLWTLFYVPAAIGSVGAIGVFANDARRFMRESLPIWILLVGGALCIGFSYGTTAFMERSHQQTLKKKIMAILYREFSSANFATKDAPQLVAIRLGGNDGPTYPVTAVYSGEKSYELSMVRHVAKVVRLTGIIEMKSKMAMQIAGPDIYKCMKKYTLLKDAKIDTLTLAETDNRSSYTGKLKVKPPLALDVTLDVVKDSFKVTLSKESDREVRAAPLVSATWQEFDPQTQEHCIRVKTGVKRGDKIDQTHWKAEAFLSGGKSIPIVIEDTRAAEDDEGLLIYLPAREAAIIQINQKIQKGEAFDDGTVITENCVNLLSSKKLRIGQELMRAMFVQADSQLVLVKERLYSVDVNLGEWNVLSDYDARMRRPTHPLRGWSLLLPGRFVRQSQVEDESITISRVADSEDEVSLNTKLVSEFSRFNLNEHVEKERKDMTEKYSADIVSAITPCQTESGLQGYTYNISNDKLYRAKYFFAKGNSLAVLTFNLDPAEGDPGESAGAIAATLRYKDVVKEEPR